MPELPDLAAYLDSLERRVARGDDRGAERMVRPVEDRQVSRKGHRVRARCQTGGKILADRALSRLLRKSWPRNIDELE